MAEETREERLAAALRENLRRRKSQARQIGQASEPQVEPDTTTHSPTPKR